MDMNSNNTKTFFKYSLLLLLSIIGITLWGSFDILGGSWIINDLTLLTFKIVGWFVLVMINIFFVGMLSLIAAFDDL